MLQVPYCTSSPEPPKRGRWFADMVNDWNKRTGKNLLVEIYDDRQRQEIEKAQQRGETTEPFKSLADAMKEHD